MKTLYIITLEPIEQRYTKQWYNTWKTQFKKLLGKKYKIKYIDGDYTDDVIENGKFLDINKTNLYKSQQIEKISKLFMNNKINDDDIFLFMDGWHYGITAIKYMIQLNNLKTKMFAYFHAGSYDPWDFLYQAGLRKWAYYNEKGWVNALDSVFVATQFHKNMIINNLNINNKNKIKVVGFPMDWKKEIFKHVNMKNIVKEQKIVFPHRLDKEKQPDKFDSLKHVINTKHYPVQFVKTLEKTSNKKEYYKLLAESKICFSANLQETFGIGTVEALMLDNVPIVPERLCYSELYKKEFVYKDFQDAKLKIKYFLENYNKDKVQKLIQQNKEKIYKQSMKSFELMCKYMVNKK